MNSIFTQWQPWLELISKSLVILAAAGLLCVTMRKAGTTSAAARHLIWSLALGALLALPLLSRALPTWRVPVLAAPVSTVTVESSEETILGIAPATTLPLATNNLTNNLNEAAPAPTTIAATSSFEWAQVLWLVWLLGAVVVLARLAIGAWQMWRITQDAERLTNYHWSALANRLSVQLDLPSHVELYLSAAVTVPVTWGVIRPRVVLPPEANAWSFEWQRIVLLHEFAHIKRRDCLTQMLANVACALYWFNPLVWRAARQLRVERELACDDCVLAVGTRATDYASCLVAIARSFNLAEAPAVAVGMACSELESRVRTILDPAIERRWLSARRQSVLVTLTGCLLLPLAALQAVSQNKPAPVVEPSVTVASPVVVKTIVPPVVVAIPTPEVSPVVSVPPVVTPVVVTDVATNVVTNVTTNVSTNVSTNVVAEVETVQDKSVAQGLTTQDLIQLKTHDVTPEFIEAIKQAGYAEATARQIVELKIHGITTAYIREAQALSSVKLSLRELVNVKVAGLTAAFVNEMKQAGFDNLSLKQLTQMKHLGVTPAYTAELKRAGFDNLNANQLTQLKALGVTESYVQQVKSWGLANVSVQEVIRLKATGVTPADAQQFKGLGFDNISLQELTRLKTHGVTDSFIKEMRALGFDKLTLDEAVKFKIHGVTPDYVRQMRAAGFKNISSSELLKLKIQGLDSILLKK